MSEGMVVSVVHKSFANTNSTATRSPVAAALTTLHCLQPHTPNGSDEENVQPIEIVVRCCYEGNNFYIIACF